MRANAEDEAQMAKVSSSASKAPETTADKQFAQYAPSYLRKKNMSPQDRRLTRLLNLMKEFIRNSEKGGTNGLRPHSALFKGDFLPCIQVANSLKFGKDVPLKVEIGMSSNATLWDLKKEIGRRIAQQESADGTVIQGPAVHPATIRIYRMLFSMVIPEGDNGKTLAELKFKPNESLTAQKKP